MASFDQIEFFMSCASCLNFSLAARYHFVSVSTLSRSISSLEQELGIKLFERGYHGHKLTAAGRDLFLCCIRNSFEYNDYLMRWSEKRHETINIGCYPFDSSFEKFVSGSGKIPSDYFSKKTKIIFVPEGEMLFALMSKHVDVGIELSEKLSGIDGFVHVPVYENEGKEYSIVCRSDMDEVFISKMMRFFIYLK